MRLQFYKLSLALQVIFAALLIQACAATQEGPTSSAAARFGANNILACLKARDRATSEADSASFDCDRPLLVIGRVSAFRELDTHDYDDFYGDYQEFVRLAFDRRDPLLSRDEFEATIAGWTRLKVASAGLMWGFYEDALVPVDLRWHLDFPSSTATVLYQGTGDLVAARSNRDGFYVLDSVLCRESSDFTQCSKGYQTGLFDARTGEQLDMFLRVVEDGARVDVVTLKALRLAN